MFCKTSAALLRLTAGLRQKDLAKLTGLSLDTVYTIENEGGPHRVEDAVRLATVLDAPLSAVAIKDFTDEETHR